MLPEDIAMRKTRHMRLIAVVTHIIMQTICVGIMLAIHLWPTLFSLVFGARPSIGELSAIHAAGPAAALGVAFVFYFLPQDTRRVYLIFVNMAVVSWLIATVLLWWLYHTAS